MNKHIVLLLIFILAFAGCRAAEDNDESNVSATASETVSEEVSEEVSQEISQEDEALTSIVGSWTECYSEEDYAGGYIWLTGFVFGENGCCVAYDTEYNVYEDEKGDPVFESCGGNSREGVYTLEGNTLTIVFDMSVQYGEGYTKTYKVSKKGENLVVNGVEYFLEEEMGYVPEGFDGGKLYGTWESNEPDGSAYLREWWIFNVNGTFEYGKGKFVKADGSEPDTVIINGYLYKAESYEKQLEGTYTVAGADMGTLTLTVDGETLIYNVSVYDDYMTVFWQYDLENDIRSEYTKRK